MSMMVQGNLLMQMMMRHNYFRDGLNKGLSFALSDSGARQLSRIGARWVPDEGGGGVFYPSSPLASGVTFPANFTVRIKVSDPQFPIYTDQPTLAKGMAWYFNNLAPDALGNAPIQALPVMGPRSSLDFSAAMTRLKPGPQRTLVIRRPNGEVVLTKQTFVPPTTTVCPLDLSLQSDGCYTATWTISGVKKPLSMTFYKSSEGLRPGDWGYFEWLPLQAAGKSAVTTGTRVVAQLVARETIWEYLLVSKTGTKVQNPSIAPVKLSNKTVRFNETAKQVALPNGSYAIQMTATATLPLQESQHLDILLEAKGLAKEMRLPYASPNLLYNDGPGGAASSKIYVYF